MNLNERKLDVTVNFLQKKRCASLQKDLPFQMVVSFLRLDNL